MNSTEYIEKNFALEKAENQNYIGVLYHIESDTIIKFIKSLPTVEASPVRHGYWRNYKDEHTCSCCGETVTGDWYDQDNDAYWYCPNCGAKMDGGTNGSD